MTGSPDTADTRRIDFLATRPDMLALVCQRFDWHGKDNPQRKEKFRSFVDAAMALDARKNAAEMRDDLAEEMVAKISNLASAGLCVDYAAVEDWIRRAADIATMSRTANKGDV